MPFNITNFAQNIADNGVIKANKFSVSLLPPPILTGTGVTSVIEMVRFRADVVKVPGVTVTTTEVNRYGIGPTQKQPFSAGFTECTISFLSDANAEIWQFFHNWTRSIFEYNGTLNAPQGREANQIPRYITEYKENYSTTVQITLYNDFGETVQEINLFQAFPTGINDIGLNWNDSQLLKINVSIAYTDYMIEGVGATNAAAGQNSQLLNRIFI